MFGNVIANLSRQYAILKTVCPALRTVRQGHRIRGKPPGIAKTIEQRLQCKLHSFEVMFNPLILFAFEIPFLSTFKIIKFI